MQEHALVRADGGRSPCSGKATTRRTDGYRVALGEKIPRKEKTRQSTVTQSRWVGRYPESRAQGHRKAQKSWIQKQKDTSGAVSTPLTLTVARASVVYIPKTHRTVNLSILTCCV